MVCPGLYGGLFLMDYVMASLWIGLVLLTVSDNIWFGV